MLTSVERALETMLFIAKQDSVGVVELAQHLDVDKSNASRILQTLLKHSFVRRDANKGKFSLGLALLGLGQACLRTFELKDVMRPFLRELFDQTRETITLVVEVDSNAICVDKIESPHYLRTHVEIGQIIPLHAGSASKALLAFLPPAKIATVIDAGPLPAFTPNTIIDPTALQKKLEEVRQLRYSTSIEETAFGAAGVAAPILNKQGFAIAAIGVGGPVARVTPEQLRVWGELVTYVATKATREVGNYINELTLR